MRFRVLTVMHLIACRYPGSCPERVARVHGSSHAIIDSARLDLAIRYLLRTKPVR